MPARRQDLLGSLLPLVKQLRQVEDAAAARFGIGMWQYAILSVVDAMPGLNQGEVAKRLQYSPNRLIGDLDHLEDSGFLQRRPGRDRRFNLLEVTAAGRRTQRAIQAEIHAREDELLADLSAVQRTQLGKIARQLAARSSRS